MLADYLFVPGEKLKHGENPIMGSIEKECGLKRACSLEEISGEGIGGSPYMPPAYFTRVDTPQPYDFEDNSFIKRQKDKEVKEIAGTSEAKLARGWIGVRLVKYAHEGPVPSEPPAGAKVFCTLNPSHFKEQLRDDERQIVGSLSTFKPLFTLYILYVLYILYCK